MNDKIEKYSFNLAEWKRIARTHVNLGRAAMRKVMSGISHDEQCAAIKEVLKQAEQLRGIVGFDPISKILDELEKKELRWRWLTGTMVGHYQDGSDTTVKLFWDDATLSAHITIGKRDYYGSNFDEAMDKAIKAFELYEESDGEAPPL